MLYESFTKISVSASDKYLRIIFTNVEHMAI